MVRYGSATALLLGGFLLLARLGSDSLRPLSSVGLVRRPGLGTELSRGLALGWAVSLALVLPSALTGHLLFRISFTPESWLHLLTSVLILISFSGLLQLLVAGLPMRLLVRVTSPAWAMTAVYALTLLLTALSGHSSVLDCLVAALAIGLFAMGFLRTRALWFSLGLQIGWAVSECLLFGAASTHAPLTGGVLSATFTGPLWLTGGSYGPESSLFAPLVLVAAWFALMYLTRDYAWHYTYESPVPGGYPVEVPPPAQHAAQDAGRPQVPLIQIAPAVQDTRPSAPQESN